MNPNTLTVITALDMLIARRRPFESMTMISEIREKLMDGQLEIVSTMELAKE